VNYLGIAEYKIYTIFKLYCE